MIWYCIEKVIEQVLVVIITFWFVWSRYLNVAKMHVSVDKDLMSVHNIFLQGHAIRLFLRHL